MTRCVSILWQTLCGLGSKQIPGRVDFSIPPKGSQVCDMIYADITYTKRIRCTLIVYWHFEIWNWSFFFAFHWFHWENRLQSPLSKRYFGVKGLLKPRHRSCKTKPGLLTLHMTPCEDVSQFSHPICSRQVHPCWCPLKRSSSEIYTPKTNITLENYHFQEEIHLQTVDFPLSC